jgi:hypothetical protein
MSKTALVVSAHPGDCEPLAKAGLIYIDQPEPD